MPRSSHILVVCLALVALGLSVVVWRQGVELERRASAPARPLEAIRIVTLSRPATAEAPSTGPRPPQPSSGAAVEHAEELLVVQTAEPRAHGRSGIARLLEDPAFLRALAVHQEGALDARYAALFRQLNLSPGELATFKRLLKERDNVVLDVAAISQELPAGPLPSATRRQSVHDARVEIESAIRASLGQERYAIYSEYISTLPHRTTVARLEQRLSYSSAPLQPQQAETLVKILAENPASTPAGGVANASVDSAEWLTLAPTSPAPAPVSERAVAQAEHVLSPPQVVALRQIQAETQAAAQAAHYLQSAVVPGHGDPAGDLSWLQFYLQ